MKKQLLLVLVVGIVVLLPVATVTQTSTSIHRAAIEEIGTGDSFSRKPVAAPRSQPYLSKEFFLEIPLSGYKLTTRPEYVMDPDENGLMTLRQDSPNTLNVRLTLKSGVFEYPSVRVSGVSYIIDAGDFAYDLDVDDARNGFFMDLIILRGIVFVELAFDGGGSQLCYRGLLSVSAYSAQVPALSGLQILDWNKSSRFVSSLAQEYASLGFTESNLRLRENYQKGVAVYVNPLREQPKIETSTSGTVTPAIVIPEITDYGIAHEQADFSTVNLAEHLPNDYWVPYTVIDVGIYRRTPGEATIKSDLQYYNKNYMGRYLGYMNNILAYAIYSHGNPEHNSDWSMNDEGTEWLTYQEVAQLWYHSYNPSTGYTTDVYPSSMILHATVCYGYSGTDGIPHMAKSFVDYGAAAFVGATVSIPGNYNDEFTGQFWSTLCQSHQTVYDATINYINSHNSHCDPDWTYNVDVKIYGNVNAVLSY